MIALFTSIIRSAIIYILVIASVRIMGKRQVGQLQPSELVITILLSEVAAMPLENSNIPLITAVIGIFMLVSFEIITSVLSMKSNNFRKIIQGNCVIIIKDGVIDQKELKQLRFTIDDVMEALRQKDVFDIKEVQYAIAETNGSLSILLKNDYRTVNLKNAGLKEEKNSLPCVIVSDGKIIKKHFADCDMTDKKLNKILKSNNVELKDVLLLTSDKYNSVSLIKKEKI